MVKITTNDIAKAAGVSQTTVSFVLNRQSGASISEETRNRVLKVAKELGYRFKPSATQERPLTIAVMVPTFANLYYPYLLQNIEIEAKALGISVLVMDTIRETSNEKRYLDYLERNPVDGLLSLFVTKYDFHTIIPTVIVSERRQGSQTDIVGLKSSTAGYMMADHMISLGHSRIAYISTPFENITPSREQRLNGIRKRLADANLEQYLTLLVAHEERELSDSAFEYQCGYELTQQLLSKKIDATAIIAVNDMTAIGCMTCLNDQGISIPAQMAVGGFDNLMFSRIMRPQLTSIDQMAFHGCKMGLRILLDKIRDGTGNTQPINVEYEPHLFPRTSTIGESHAAVDTKTE